MKKRTARETSRREAVATPPESNAERHASWGVPLALFLTLRLFSAYPYYILGGDQCTYLELGRTFPKHQLFDLELYLIHPPLFGYTIGLFRLFLPLLAAGLVATLALAVLNFFAARKLGEFDGLPRAAVFAGLTYLALSRPAVAYDYHVARVSLLVATTALALFAFLRLLRSPSRKTLLWSMAANVACLLVSDQALLLLPCQALLLLRRDLAPNRRMAAAVGAVSIVAAAAWPLVRLVEFTRRTNLPAGIDGTIEFTRNFPAMALLQPNFLPLTNAHRSLFTQTSLSLENVNLISLFYLPCDLLLIPRALGALLLILLLAAAVARAESRRRSLIWLGMGAVFLMPVGMGMNEWYGMGFVVPFALLVMEGFAACLAWLRPLLREPERALTRGLIAVCALAALVWIAIPGPAEPFDLLSPRGGTHFLFTRPAVTRASSLSSLFAPLPRDTGIMAPQGLSPEIVYLTDKRVVALPFDPRLLDPLIDKYRISYLVTSSEYLSEYELANTDLYTSHMVSRYLFAHPERYRLVRSQRETYPTMYPPLDYYVFQVQPRAIQ